MTTMQTTYDSVYAYSIGLFFCSICAPEDMLIEEVIRQVEAQHPCGTEEGWTLSEDKTFADGCTANGGVVDCDRGRTRHWLLDA